MHSLIVSELIFDMVAAVSLYFLPSLVEKERAGAAQPS